MADGGLGDEGEHLLAVHTESHQPLAATPVRTPVSSSVHARSPSMAHGMLVSAQYGSMAIIQGRPAATACLAHPAVGRSLPTESETRPTRATHHSLRYHLTPPGTMQDATVHPVGTHPPKSYRSLHYTFVQKGVHVRV